MNLADIFSFENLYAAHELCRCSKQHKRGTIMFEMEAGPAIERLSRELISKKYKIGKYREFKIYDPKERIIKALPYKDRVVQMCFCKNAIMPRLEKRLIYDNAASRVGKGSHFAVARLHRFMKALFINTGGNDVYFLKCDVAKYFPSIDHDVLLNKLRQCDFSDDEMWFMTMVVESYGGGVGVPLGNQTSQWFALLYMDELDRLVKEKLRVPHYIRYMDDFVLLHKDKEFLQECRAQIERLCNDKLKIRLNAKTQIGKLKNGLDFLGFNHKLTATGMVTRVVRATSRMRQRRYLKTISKCYMNGLVDDEYIDVRVASFRSHLNGTRHKKIVINKINSLRCKKRRNGVT